MFFEGAKQADYVDLIAQFRVDRDMVLTHVGFYLRAECRVGGNRRTARADLMYYPVAARM
jgi:hypothetical protein